MVEADEWLHPVEDEINRRYNMYINRLQDIEKSSGSLVDYANGHRYYGWQRDEQMKGWWFREWLPEAKDVYILATSTLGSAHSSACNPIVAYGASSYPMQCMPTDLSTAHYTSCTSTATMAGVTAYLHTQSV